MADTSLYVYGLVIVLVLVVIGLLTVCALACFGVRWCCRLGASNPKQTSVMSVAPPGNLISLQRLETTRLDHRQPVYSAQVAAENAFLDALPGLPPR